MIKDISILIGGAAGQGIQTVGALLAQVCYQAGLFVFTVEDFQSRVRGGHNFHLLRISNQPLCAPKIKPDIVVGLDQATYTRHGNPDDEHCIALVGNPVETERDKSVFFVPFEQLARESGGTIAVNTVAAGTILAVLGGSFQDFEAVLKTVFSKKGADVLELNRAAAKKGMAAGKQIPFFQGFDFSPKAHAHKMMSGASAAALGALAADCRFFPFYPMSPGTPIIESLIPFENQLPMVIEQAEDELAAVNMAIGASFAGVRSMTATSGGGFSLMTEGLGLSGMSETPVVIINAQRPGPATGLATRTAQADLLFAIHASQDEFPRFVFAPGGVLEIYKTMKRAFHLSEKYQVPAIVLLDQYLVDSIRTEPDEFTIGRSYQSYIDDQDLPERPSRYSRYQMSVTGISPRRLPCKSDSLVRALGNEHTPEGFTTEDPGLRELMVEKRLKKQTYMTKDMSLPSVFCMESDFFLVGWGSTKGSIMEACLHLREEGINAGWIIFEDIWPLDEAALTTLLSAKKMIMVEGNATSQLGSLIRQLTGIDYQSTILKYDGRPIYPEFIIERVKKMAGQ